MNRLMIGGDTAFFCVLPNNLPAFPVKLALSY